MKMPMPFASMRMTRTSVPPPPPMRDEVPQAMSDPMDLERNYSDDSSVFSGLAEEASHHHDLDDEGDYYEDDLMDGHEDNRLGVTQSTGTGSQLSSSDDDIIYHRRQYESSSQLTSSHLAPTPKGILRSSLSGPYTSQPTFSSSKMGGGSSTEEESDAYSSELPSDAPTESTLTDRSHRSRLREMPPMVDSDTAFGMSSTLSSSQPPSTRGAIGEAESGSRCSQAPDTNNSNPWLHRIAERNGNNPELFPDSDTNTQMTWGSANDVPRPKGTVKLVSQVSFLGDMKAGKKQVRLAVGNSNHPQYHETQREERNPLEECPTDDSGSRIVEMLNDFEKQMDENLKSIQDEDETNDTSDDNADVGGVLSELQDMPPRQVRSEEDTSSTVLTPHKARKLQRILHKARKEVEVLRDNNEQFKSEIEQMEEEHKSELKLIEDRTKQKLGELRSMYQEEIDKLVLEKDAAVVEAGRQAARYAESGRKQVLSLKKQLERLTSTATATIKEKVGEAGRTALAHKDKEIAARLGALRTSYENELEKLRKDCDGRVKSEVERAVSSVAQRVRLNQDVLISELREQIDGLRNERRTFETVLKAVKGNFDKHYPDEMKLYAKRSEDFAGSARKLLDEGASPKDGSEKDLRDVVEIFAFLLECQEKKVASAQYMTEIEETKRERNEVYSQMRKELLLRHRAEIDHLRKERDEAAEKLKVVEANFKNMGREKRFLEEKHKRAMENHRKQVERLESEKEAALEIEKSRKDLAVAMAAGQRHIKNASLRSQDEMKSNNERSKQSAVGLQPSESTEESAIPAPPTRPSISIDHQKYAFESASVRKARTFLTQHSPRESPRISPAYSQHRRSFGDFERKQSLPGDSPIKSYDLLVPTKKADITSESDCEKKKYILASKDNANLSDAQLISESQKVVVPDPDEERPPHPKSKLEPNPISDARDAVDPLPDIKNSNSNMSNSSDRSKDTILSNLRNQAKKAKKETVGDSLISKEPSGNLSEGEPSARKKSFAILRTFKTKKEGHRRDPSLDHSSCLGSQVDRKEDSSNLMSRSIRRARMIKNLFDSNGGKVDDDRYSRGSLDHSISSLQTNTGNDGIADDYQVENSNKHGQVLDARQSKAFLEARNTESVKQSSEDSSKVPQRSQNTLGMFVHVKQLKETDDRVGSLPTMSSDIDSNLGMEQATITETSTQTDRCSDDKKNLYQLRENDACISVTKTNASVHFKESSAAHLNLKKPNLDGFHDSKDMIASTASRINAKKRVSVQSGVPKVDSIFTIRNPSSESYNENAIPKTISVTSPTKRSSNATFATASSTHGHTLLAKPLNVIQNSKNSHHPGMVASNLSASTSPTALTSDEDGLLYDSQAQMRKYPPLTDDEVTEDEDESLSNSLDRYQTMESPPNKNSEHYDDFNDIPLVASRSVDADPEDVRESIVVQGQPIGGGTRGTRNTANALASFRNGYLKGKDTYESTSQTGSTVSEATTAITAHTRSVTFSGSTSRRTGTMSTTLPLSSHYHGGSSHSRTSHTGTSGRFAALKARVRVRREAMQEGN